MLVLEPVIDDRACIVYIAQTFTRWHEGIARPIYADYWLEITGPLTTAEITAIDFLREKLQGGDGCELIREAIQGCRMLEGSIVETFKVLSKRAEQVYRQSQQGLLLWKKRIQDVPPQWFICANRELDRFFGIEDDYVLRVYLLPSRPGGCGGTGGMFVGPDAITLECSGWPLDGEETLLLTLLHEAAHAIHQRRVIDPLVFKAITTPEVQQIAEEYKCSPIANLPDFPLDLSSYIGELVIHSLVPDGVLREVCGLRSSEEYWSSICRRGKDVLEHPDAGWGAEDIYDAWVMMGAAAMVQIAREYIAEERGLDEAFIRNALITFQSLYDFWKRSG